MRRLALEDPCDTAETPTPRADDRRLTAADLVGYAIIALLMLVWLFGVDGGMSR